MLSASPVASGECGDSAKKSSGTGSRLRLMGLVSALCFTCVALSYTASRPLNTVPPAHMPHDRNRSAAHGLVHFVLWDTEQTAWEGSNARRWTGLVPGTQEREHREIVQINALAVTWDPTGNEIVPGRSLRLYVRPVVHPRLSAYVTELTGITQAKLEAEGMPFAAALQALLAFAAETRGRHQGCTPMLSWGNDWTVVEENQALLRAPLPSHPADWAPCPRDVRPVFVAAGLNVTGYSSGTIHRAVSAPTAGHVHDAGWDCVSIQLAMRAVVARSEAAAGALRHLTRGGTAPTQRHKAIY